MKDVLVTVLENLSGLGADAFWTVLDNRSLTHPYDSEGRRQAYDAIPRSVSDLIDDPFRSLVSELRRAGGFAKQTMPFSEFPWADFLRRQIDRKLMARDFALRGKSAQTREGPSGKLLTWLVRASPKRARLTKPTLHRGRCFILGARIPRSHAQCDRRANATSH